MELDVVGLLETDLHVRIPQFRTLTLSDMIQRIVYGNRDLTRVMIEDMGYVS